METDPKESYVWARQNSNSSFPNLNIGTVVRGCARYPPLYYDPSSLLCELVSAFPRHNVTILHCCVWFFPIYCDPFSLLCEIVSDIPVIIIMILWPFFMVVSDIPHTTVTLLHLRVGLHLDNSAFPSRTNRRDITINKSNLLKHDDYSSKILWCYVVRRNTYGLFFINRAKRRNKAGYTAELSILFGNLRLLTDR